MHTPGVDGKTGEDSEINKTDHRLCKIVSIAPKTITGTNKRTKSPLITPFGRKTIAQHPDPMQSGIVNQLDPTATYTLLTNNFANQHHGFTYVKSESNISKLSSSGAQPFNGTSYLIHQQFPTPDLGSKTSVPSHRRDRVFQNVPNVAQASPLFYDKLRGETKSIRAVPGLHPINATSDTRFENCVPKIKNFHDKH